MNIAISSHIHIQHKLTPQWLDQVQAAGIPAVEIFCAKQHFDWLDTRQIQELRAWFASNPLKLHSLHSPMYTDDIWGRSGSGAINICELEKRRRVVHVDEIKRALEFAEYVPFTYLIQHVGTPTETWDERKIDSTFSSLEELKSFAGNRGVKILLENIPNEMSTAERLNHLLRVTHLDINFVFDSGHANIMEGVQAAYEQMAPRIKSTHLHDNNGKQDQHLFPYSNTGGTIDWDKTIRMLRQHRDQYPLLLELREVAGQDNLLEAKRVLERFLDTPDEAE